MIIPGTKDFLLEQYIPYGNMYQKSNVVGRFMKASFKAKYLSWEPKPVQDLCTPVYLRS